jgi:hypothetical protein
MSLEIPADVIDGKRDSGVVCLAPAERLLCPSCRHRLWRGLAKSFYPPQIYHSH